MIRPLNTARLVIELAVTAMLTELVIMSQIDHLATAKAPSLRALLDALILIAVLVPVAIWRITAVLDRPPLHHRRSDKPRYSLVLSGAVLATGLILSLGAARQVKLNLVEQARQDFEHRSLRIASEIRQRFDTPITGLRSAQGLDRVAHGIVPTELRTFTETVLGQDKMAGVRGLGYIVHVNRDDIQRFEAAQRLSHTPDYAIQTSGNAPDLYVVQMVEPALRNRAALGVDLWPDPSRRESTLRAIRSGEPTLSSMLRLKQDPQKRPAVLLMLACYEGADLPSTPALRQTRFKGIYYNAIILAELLTNLEDVGNNMVDIALYDQTGGEQQKDALYTTDATHAHVEAPTHAFTTTMSIGGRQWLLTTHSNPEFDASHRRHSPTWVGLGGVLLSLMCAWATWLMLSRQTQAEMLAARLTEDLSRLADVARHTSNAVIITDRHQRITWVNDGFSRLYGYTPEEAIGEEMGALVGSVNCPVDRLQKLAEAQTTQQPIRIELLNRHKDGHDLWIDTELQPRLDHEGQFIGFIELAQNISALKTAQEDTARAMGEIQDLLRTLNEHAIVSIADASGLITDVNNAFCRISGYQRDELIGRPHSIVNSGVHPASFWQDMWRSIASGQAWHQEVCNRAKDGSLYWVDSIVAPILNPQGHVMHFISIRRDITAHKLAEEQRIETSNLLQSVLHSASRTAIIATDRDMQVVLFNSGAEHLLGYSAQEVIGKLTPAQFMRESDILERQSRVMASIHRPPSLMDRLLSPDMLGVEHDTFCVRKDGSEVPITQMVTPLRNAAGKVTGYLGILTDRTQRLIYETSLKEAKHLAEQANVEKSRFLANMSHEIRTPMNAILGMLKLLLRTPLNTRQLDYASKTDAAARNLLGLLNDVLDFSKIEAGKMSLDPHPFCMQDLLDELNAIVSTGLGARPVQLRWQIDPNMPVALLGDALRLQQVLLNLVGNAIKFTEAGSVTVRVEVTNRTTQDVILHVAVQDTGIGISPDALPRIFTGFTQAESSTTRRFGGSGLGLAISQRIVNMMGGQIHIASQLGVGSTFSFDVTLPVCDATQLPRSARFQPSGELRLAGCRILLAEDNPLNQQVAVELLSDEGALVQVAHHGEECVRRVLDAPDAFDVILMDMHMPVMDGPTATREIRGALGDGAPPVIALTANALASDRDACLAAGMVDHLSKPFDLDTLVAMLQRHSHLPIPPSPPHRAKTGTPPMPEQAQALAQQAHLDLAGALQRLNGRQDIYARLLESFAQDLATASSQIKSRWQTQDFPALQAWLHTQKGLAATLGHASLASACAQAEALVGECPAETRVDRPLPPALASLEAQMITAHHTLLALSEALHASTHAPMLETPDDLDRTALCHDLAQLCQLLQRSDMQALSVHDHIQRKYSSSGVNLSELALAMSQLAFAKAQAVSEGILAEYRPA